MDLDVIRAKQDSIVRCIQRISTKKHLSYSELLDDYDAQDVIVQSIIQDRLDDFAQFIREVDGYLAPATDKQDAAD